MGFADDFKRFQVKVSKRGQDIHNRACDLAFQSIVNGSEITGAPGQPVDTGFLRGSWLNVFDGRYRREIVTKTVYAPIIEDGISHGQQMQLHSKRGGFHSVALTRLGWDKLVEQAVRDTDAGITNALNTAVAGLGSNEA